MNGAGKILVPLALMLPAACNAPTSYFGIDFAAANLGDPVQTLARRSASGDKRAQLALGIAFEEGRGVAVDLRRATKLYRLAASDSGGVIYVYRPPVGRGDKGTVIPVDTGPRSSGLGEAKARLIAIKAKTRRTQ